VHDFVRADLLPGRCGRKHVVRKSIPKAGGKIRQRHCGSREEELDRHVRRRLNSAIVNLHEYSHRPVALWIFVLQSCRRNAMVVFEELEIDGAYILTLKGR